MSTNETSWLGWFSVVGWYIMLILLCCIGSMVILCVHLSCKLKGGNKHG